MSSTRSKCDYIFLALGLLFWVGSVPMFLLKKPIVVTHQSFKYLPSSTEVIMPGAGVFYGFILVGIGTFFFWCFFKIVAASKEDSCQELIGPGAKGSLGRPGAEPDSSGAANRKISVPRQGGPKAR